MRCRRLALVAALIAAAAGRPVPHARPKAVLLQPDVDEGEASGEPIKNDGKYIIDSEGNTEVSEPEWPFKGEPGDDIDGSFTHQGRVQALSAWRRLHNASHPHHGHGDMIKPAGVTTLATPSWPTPLTQVGPLLIVYITQNVGGSTQTPFATKAHIQSSLFSTPLSFSTYARSGPNTEPPMCGAHSA